MSTSPVAPASNFVVAASSRDLDAARLELVRRRVLVFTVTVGTLLVLLSLLPMLVAPTSLRPRRIAMLGPAFAGVVLIVMPFFRLRHRRAQMSLRNLVNRTAMIIVVAICILLMRAEHTARSIAQILTDAGLQHVQIGTLIPAMLSLFVLHTAASMIIPWTLAESARPVAVVVLIGVINIPFMTDPMATRVGGVLALALAGFPGMLICWFRFSRFRQRVEVAILNRRYREVAHELSFARRIHEKLFPQPILSGPVRFEFRYRPMREIGGDFIDSHIDVETGAVTLALIDVTGHGIAAALAVNRLHGEMKRILGQRARVSPGELLSALNEYIHLTLADESVFATAIVLRLDPTGSQLSWASAGHPPAMLIRASSGEVELLDSTAMMLGALAPANFDHGERSISVTLADCVIVYTDGVIESRDAGEQPLGISGLREVVASHSRIANPSATLEAILHRIGRHRAGEAEDDVLIAAMSFVSAPSHAAPSTAPVGRLRHGAEVRSHG